MRAVFEKIALGARIRKCRLHRTQTALVLCIDPIEIVESDFYTPDARTLCEPTLIQSSKCNLK